MACARSRRDRSSSSSASLGNFTEAKPWNSSQTHTSAHLHTSPYQLWSRNAIGGYPLWKVLAVIFKRDFISCMSAFHEQRNELTSTVLSQITWDCNVAILCHFKLLIIKGIHVYPHTTLCSLFYIKCRLNLQTRKRYVKIATRKDTKNNYCVTLL